MSPVVWIWESRANRSPLSLLDRFCPHQHSFWLRSRYTGIQTPYFREILHITTSSSSPEWSLPPTDRVFCREKTANKSDSLCPRPVLCFGLVSNICAFEPNIFSFFTILIMIWGGILIMIKRWAWAGGWQQQWHPSSSIRPLLHQPHCTVGGESKQKCVQQNARNLSCAC